MNPKYKFLAVVLCTIYLPFHGSAQQPIRKNYSLFNPVPRNQMREMETDRPGVTETPITLDAGHFQYETALFNVILEKTELQHSNTLILNEANFKMGITGFTDLQIGFQTYGRQVEKELATGNKVIKQGFGDVTLRIKQNLLGNNDGKFALALLPYVKIPTSTYDKESRFEGGLIVPLQYKLPGEWQLGLQVEVDRLKDDDQQAMHTEFQQSLTISHAIFKDLDGIVESAYSYDFKARQGLNFLNAAIQFEIAEDFKLDAGFNYGIQHFAARNYFFGLSYRL